MSQVYNTSLTNPKRLFLRLASEPDAWMTWIADAGLAMENINLRGTADQVWTSILQEARKQGKVMNLINLADKKYGESRNPEIINLLAEAKRSEEEYLNRLIEVNDTSSSRSDPLSLGTTKVSADQTTPHIIMEVKDSLPSPDGNKPSFVHNIYANRIMMLPPPDTKKLLPALSLSSRHIATIFPQETPKTLENHILQLCDNYANLLQSSKSLTGWLKEFHIANSDVMGRKSISSLRCHQFQKDLQALSTSLQSECYLFEMNQPLRTFLLTDAQALFGELSDTFRRLDPLLAKVKALMRTDAKSTVRNARQAIETELEYLIQQLVKIDILMLPVLPKRVDKEKICKAIYHRYTATDFALFCQKLLKDVFKCSDAEYNRIMAQQDEKKAEALLDYCQSRGFYTKLLFCLIKDPYFREILQEIV